MANQYYGSRFFKGAQLKPRSFNYKPRVYDEDKSNLAKRKRLIEQKIAREKDSDTQEFVPSRNINFRSANKSSRIDIQKNKRSAMIRLGVILLALIFGFKYLMDWIETTPLFQF